MDPMQPKKPMAIVREPTPMRMYEATFTVSDDSSGEDGNRQGHTERDQHIEFLRSKRVAQT